MSSIANLSDLSTEISENTKIITSYLSANGLEATSFSIDGLYDLPLNPKDKEVQLARSKVIAATKDLLALTVGPKESLRNLGFSVRLSSHQSTKPGY